MNQNTASRIHTIDSIRGLALLGILVINIQTYALYLLLRPEQVYQLGLDHPATYAPTQFLMHLFVQGQFYTIYSFLFGLGFYLMMQKNTRLGLNGNRLFARRLWWLLLIGLIHGLLFWFGDILHNYALLGFTLLYFNKKKVATIAKWIVGLFLLGILLQVGKAILFPVTPASLEASYKELDPVVMQVVQTWQKGSFLQVMNLQKLGVLLLHVMGIESGMAGYIHYEIMFLLGLVAGRTAFFNRISVFKPKLVKSALFIVLPAFLLKGLSGFPILQRHLLPAAWFNAERMIIATAGFIAVPLLTIVYLIGLTFLFQKATGRFFTWIGNTGRMGLTNYLGQTLICMLLFYGYAGGLSGRLSLLQCLIAVVLIYSFQVLYSNLWLQYYTIGPIEQLWRKLTYGNQILKPSNAPADKTKASQPFEAGSN